MSVFRQSGESYWWTDQISLFKMSDSETSNSWSYYLMVVQQIVNSNARLIDLESKL
jgi:hypothetical protein